MKLGVPESDPRVPSVRSRSTRRSCSRRQWLVIILVVAAAHMVFVIFFKIEYFEVFRAEIRGDQGTLEIRGLDRPFSLIPYPQILEPHAVVTRIETLDAEELDDIAPSEIAEPTLDIEPFGGAPSGGTEGRAGPRRTAIEPKPLFIPWPAYPEDAPGNIRGTVELLVLVNANGIVDEIRVSRGLPHESFNRTAVDAARRIRFIPGQKDGAPTAMWVRLSIGFQPR